MKTPPNSMSAFLMGAFGERELGTFFGSPGYPGARGRFAVILGMPVLPIE